MRKNYFREVFYLKRLILALFFITFFTSCAFAAPKIGIMTGTVSQGEEEYRAAEEMIQKYGKDRVLHVTYPDKFMDEQETTISQVLSMASDPEVKAIVVVQAIPGTAAAIDKVREVRDDILFICGTVEEEPYMMAGKADMLFEVDEISRGTSIIEKAKQMGTKTFVHYSFPRHMAMPLLAQRRKIMEETAKKIGVNFVFINAPDPTAEGGIAATQQFILEDVPRQTARYGKKTAFFSTNCGMQEPLIKAVVKSEAYYPEQCCPSPFHGLPNALGIEIKNKGDVPYMINAIKAKTKELNMTGHIGSWTAPITMSYIRAASAYAWEYTNGRITDKQDLKKLQDLMRKEVKSVKIRPLDAKKAPNFLMVLGESIIF